MLPTPSTSHVDFDKIYEPSEDSYLLLDTLSSPSESQYLNERFGSSSHGPTTCISPLIVEVGTGSGVVLAFVAANAETIFGRRDVLALGTDLNVFACQAARRTVTKACGQAKVNAEDTSASTTQLSSPGVVVVPISDTVAADLTSSLRSGSVDVLIFNPPYVPTPCRSQMAMDEIHTVFEDDTAGLDLFARDSYLLSLSYAGGVDGMEVTNRLLEQLPTVLSPERGVAYILLCQQNKPNQIMDRVRQWGTEWSVAIAGHLGTQGGWEKLCVMKIARVVNGLQ